METKVRKIGNSYGIVLPREALHAMKVKEGDTLYLTEAPECFLRVTPERKKRVAFSDPLPTTCDACGGTLKKFSDMMAIADRAMRRYRNALRELAK